MTDRYKLNPCDSLFLANHIAMRRAGLGGLTITSVYELAGHLDREVITQALRRLCDAHPMLRSVMTSPLIWGRSHWRPGNHEHDPVLDFHDLTTHEDWRDRAVRLLEEQVSQGTDVTHGPRLRLLAVNGTSQQWLLALTWPHALMDAEGGQWMIHELNRLRHEVAPQAHAILMPDTHRINPLKGISLSQRLKLLRQGLKLYRSRQSNDHAVANLPTSSGQGKHRMTRRQWSGGDWRTLVRLASKCCPDGPNRLSRYLVICTMRAAQAMLAQRGIDAREIVIPLPVPLLGRDDARRGMPGNYVVWMMLRASSEVVRDKRLLADDLARQMEQFTQSRHDLANWAVMWGCNRLPMWCYSRLFTGVNECATGFTYFTQIDPPPVEILGHKVTNVWACATINSPPGINPVFVQYGSSLNLTICWHESRVAENDAEQYTRRLEAELFDTGVDLHDSNA